MPKIKISDLSLNGSELLNDPESFLQDLSNQQLLDIHGGNSIISQVTVGVGLLVLEEPISTSDATSLSTSLSPQESTALVVVL